MSDVEQFIAEQVEAIDEKITAIDNHRVVRAAQKLLEQRQTLMNARRALLNAGPRTTGGNGGGRVTQDEVIAWFRRHEPGTAFTTSAIAEAMGHSEPVIRGHLNRGRDERFIQLLNKQWVLRDPKAGINSASDVGEDDE